MSSDSSRIAKMFASFDLSSISISFAGMMGDFAVWAICDTTTGEITYLVDDGGGSESYEFFCLFNRLTNSQFYKIPINQAPSSP